APRRDGGRRVPREPGGMVALQPVVGLALAGLGGAMSSGWLAIGRLGPRSARARAAAFLRPSSAGAGQLVGESTERGFPARLPPQLGERRPAAARPQALEGRQGARIAPVVLVVALAQECPQVRGERAAAQVGPRTQPGIQLA